MKKLKKLMAVLLVTLVATTSACAAEVPAASIPEDGSAAIGSLNATSTSLSTAPSETAPAQSLYTDVPLDHWAYADIIAVTEKGLMAGYGNGLFGPGDSFTRAQVAQVLYRLANGQPVEDPALTIADLGGPGVWYADAVTWYCETLDAYGCTKDQTGAVVFSPNEPATRGFVFTAMYRLSQRCADPLPQTIPAATFPDLASRPLIEQQGISALQQAGVVAGYPNGNIGPEDTISRAESAKVFNVFSELYPDGAVAVNPLPALPADPAPESSNPTPDTPTPADPTPTPDPTPAPEPATPPATSDLSALLTELESLSLDQALARPDDWEKAIKWLSEEFRDELAAYAADYGWSCDGELTGYEYGAYRDRPDLGGCLPPQSEFWLAFANSRYQIEVRLGAAAWTDGMGHYKSLYEIIVYDISGGSKSQVSSQIVVGGSCTEFYNAIEAYAT